MRSITVAIPDDAASKLADLARREYRRPKDQAALLILAGLKLAGLAPERDQSTKGKVGR